MKETKKICSIATFLPPTLTPVQRNRYIQAYLASDADTSLICGIVTDKFSSLSDDALPPLILAPAVKQCIVCRCNLVENHHCVVKVYNTSSFMKADKVTLRCLKCRITYNYAMWGDKDSNGFRNTKGVCRSQ